MTELREQVLRITVVLVGASAVLIPPSLLDIGGSWMFVGVSVLFGAGLFFVRDLFAQFPPALNVEVGEYLPAIWLAPIVAAGAVVIAGPSVSPGELQALGGIAGFVGVVNYLLRPVYLFVYGLGKRVVNAI